MASYSIEQLLSMKSRFTEKPYPEFSIDQVCRRFASPNAAALVRGTNAYVPKRATNVDDAVRKAVQSALNRLNEDNFEEIAVDLQGDMFLEPHAVRTFVQLAFEKALQEPTFSHLYARLCYYLARYEVQRLAANPGSPTDGGPRSSVVRNAIVERAQQEFDSKDNFVAPEHATTQEEVDEAYSRFVARKKSNMKFVGQLYLAKVLSINVMSIVLSELLRPAEEEDGEAKPGGFPTDLNVEVLIEFLGIVGARMEAQLPEEVAEVYERFGEFVNRRPPYPPRIRFKIMDSIDLRARGWVSRDAKLGADSPASMGGRPATRSNTASRPVTASSPSAMTPTRKGQMSFPDTPSSPQQPSNTAASSVAAPKPVSTTAAGSWKNVLVGNSRPAAAASAASPALPTTATTPSTTTAAAAAAAAAAPPVKAATTTTGTGSKWGPSAPKTSSTSDAAAGLIDYLSTADVVATAGAPVDAATVKRVGKILDELRTTWSWTPPEAADATTTAVPLSATWKEKCASLALSNSELVAAAVMHVTSKACTTTRSYAQAEAAGFLALGLGVSTSEAIPGLCKTLVYAVLEGIIEDTPKFNQRLVRVLEDVLRAHKTGTPHEEGEELAQLDIQGRTELSGRLASMLLLALPGLKACEYMDDVVAEALMPVWKRLLTSLDCSAPVVEEPTLTACVLGTAERLSESGGNPLIGVAAAQLLRSAKDSGWITGQAATKYVAAGPVTDSLRGLLRGQGFGAAK